MKKTSILIFLLCLITGITIGTQTKVTKGDHAFVSAKSIIDMKTTVESEKLEIERLKELYQVNLIKLEEYKSNPQDQEQVHKTVENELLDAKMRSGFTDIAGPGVEVIMDDGVREIYEWEDANDIIVHDLDVLLIINDLVGAGAEAISINGQRLMNTTEISCSGHSIRINNQFFAQPFIIKAIGDSGTLEAAMTVKGSYGDLLREYGLIFNVEKKIK